MMVSGSTYSLTVAILLSMVADRVECYSDGATADSCHSLLPIHSYSDSDTPIPPISCLSGGTQCNGLTLSVTRRHEVVHTLYSCDSEYEVTLSSTRDFIGYLIQARALEEGEPLSELSIVGTMLTAGPWGRILHCNSTPDSPVPLPNSATQNMTIPTRNVTVTWKAPQPFKPLRTIQFHAAVVEDLDHFYLPVTSQVLEPLISSCESYLPFLSLGTTAGVATREMLRLDDWASEPIPIHTGFPFSTYNHTLVYIGTNGVFSFGYRETGYWHHISEPTRFYAAPFWGDVNIEDGGDIFYETHTAPSLLIDQVSSFVSLRRGIEFSANWMTVAYWRNAQQFGYETLHGNTFQGIILTDGLRSFMVSTFRNQSLDWFDSDVRIGFMGDLTHSLFGPLNNTLFSSLFSTGLALYYNEIYQLSIDGAELTQVQPALTAVDIVFRSDGTFVDLTFDLAVDPTTCDTTQFSIQTLDGTVTFRPAYRTLCAQMFTLTYSEENGDNEIQFALHPTDHIRLHSTGMVNSVRISGTPVLVSIGSSFVRTRGLTGILPVYFIDLFTALVSIGSEVEIHPLHIELDMTRAEFNVVFNVPVTSNMSQVGLSCPEGVDSLIIEGLWSTPVPASSNSTRLSLRILPHSFTDLCSTLYCIGDGYITLQHIHPLNDVFGNDISSESGLQYYSVPVIGSDSCSLGVDGQDPVDRNFTRSDMAPLGLYLQVGGTESEAGDVLYPLLASEVYLPDCVQLRVLSIVCLRLESSASTPQLVLTDSDAEVPFSNTEYSSRALFASSVPPGEFHCISAEGHTVSALVADGLTYLSTSEAREVSLGLGSYWSTSLTVGLCPPNLNTHDILFTTDSGVLTGYTISSSYQTVLLTAGPLYLEDMSDVHAQVLTNSGYVTYPSIFTITIEVPAVHAYTSGSSRGTTAVVLARPLVNASIVCQVEDEYVTVVWVEYHSSFSSPSPISEDHTSYNLSQNGQNLVIRNMDLEYFLMAQFECQILSSPSSDGSIPVVNFTTVAIAEQIVISTEHDTLTSGLVTGQLKNNSVLSASSLLDSVLSLSCYGASGYGEIRWSSTLPHMIGTLSEGTHSPHYSVDYSGSVGVLSVHISSSASGSLTCYSQEAGLLEAAPVTLHITDDVCTCAGTADSSYPISLCSNTSRDLPCSCPEGYVGDGVLCAVDRDRDGYTEVDLSALRYCQSNSDNQLCQQDICPDLYNPLQLPDKLDGEHSNGVAFEIDEVVLPTGVIVANISTIAFKSVKCLGTEGSSGLAVTLFRAGTDSVNIAQDLISVEICEMEAKIYLQTDSTFEGAMQCYSSQTGDSAWIYFTRDSCVCIGPNEGDVPDYITTCERAGVDACDCSGTECECSCWFTGDGRTCSGDTDGDGYPDHTLSTLCAGNSLQDYCIQDLCPSDYDPGNDPGACAMTEDPGSVCEGETDSTWRITWSDTRTGYYDTQSCPSSVASSAAYAFRMCQENGVWADFIDTSCCKDIDFETISDEFEDIFSGGFSNSTTAQLSVALADLVVATTPPDDRSSLYAKDLETTNDILKDTIDFLRQGVQNKLLDQLNTEVVQVIDNVLEESNNDGWGQLSNTEEVAEKLLDNAELYGVYLIEAIGSPNVDVTLNEGEIVLNASFNNIYIAVTVQDGSRANDVVFPVAKEDFSLEPVFGESLAHIKIPAELLETRANETNAQRVFAVNMVIENINELLLVNEGSTEVNGTNYTTRAVTNLLVSQVVAGNETSRSSRKLSIPVQLVFVTEEIKNISRNPRCVYYDFENSEWLDDGVTTQTVTVAPDGRSYHVLCSTDHFTSFAVLVDVADVEMEIPSSEAFALTLVTYVGCGISLLCLGLSILFYLTYRKALFTSVHYFIHLNLAIALFLGYAVFLAGSYYGPQNRTACGVVAGALHYIFLSVFCWMLCEGIMLYLMLVIVFSRISKKWWIFFLLGWGLPVIVVAVAVGVRYEDYGDPSQGFCWVSVDQGLIWAFVGPMLAVILLNMFFLCASLRSLYRVTVGRFGQEQDKKPLFKKLLMASLILLPLLGVTWVFGLLAVNRHTTVFTWLFTIFNSLQGLFFFIFHVIRSEKMWSSITRCLPGEKDKRGRSRKISTQSISKSGSFLVDTLKRKPKKVSELSSDAVIVLGNPLAVGKNPFGAKKDEDLGLATTVLM